MAVSVKADHLIDVDDIIDVHSSKKVHVRGPLKLQSRSPLAYQVGRRIGRPSNR